MPVKNVLSSQKKADLQPYDRIKDYGELKRTHVPFTGSPQQHPYDPEKLLLVIDPLSGNFSYYEFKLNDISYVEELPKLVNLEGDAVTIVRLWLKKKTVALHCTPFLVTDFTSE